jgi:hypothetical protein
LVEEGSAPTVRGPRTAATGAQFDDLLPSKVAACEFWPPADVYDEGWGGIPEVRWQINPWGNATAAEITAGCYEGSCVQVSRLGQYSGFHVYYRQAFPSSTFETVSLWLRAASSGGEHSISASHDGERCDQNRITVGPEWTEHVIDVAAACSALPLINAITIDNPGDPMTLQLDETWF